METGLDGVIGAGSEQGRSALLSHAGDDTSDRAGDLLMHGIPYVAQVGSLKALELSDNELIDELFERFELYCRGSVDTLIGREVERIIRKVNSGENYAKWFADRDELNLKPGVGQRETPDNYVREEYGDDYFDGVESDGPADHDLYEDDFDEEDTEIDELDAFDEFLDSEAVMQKEDNPNPDAAKEDMDDDDEEKDYE